MTAPSRPKTRKTRCIAAGVAAALALGSCSISVSIRELRVELFPAAVPAPKPKPQPKAPPAKERIVNRFGIESKTRRAHFCRPPDPRPCSGQRMRAFQPALLRSSSARRRPCIQKG